MGMKNLFLNKSYDGIEFVYPFIPNIQLNFIGSIQIHLLENLIDYWMGSLIKMSVNVVQM